MGSDPNDFSEQYNTPLTAQQEKQFRTAYPNTNDLYDYDLRGAWLAGSQKAGNGHLPDTYKKPNHPTFSTHSQYSGKDGYVGGSWMGDDNSGWNYTASPTNLKFHPGDELQQYFQKVEPNSHLFFAPVLPKTKP